MSRGICAQSQNVLCAGDSRTLSAPTTSRTSRPGLAWHGGPPRQLSDEVGSYVRELIVSGHLRSGEFIRQEHIAEELELSATPVREGLLSLKGEGFVLLKPRRGFVVAPLSAADVRDLFTAQALLAGGLFCRAAGRTSQDDPKELTRVHEALPKAAEAGDAGAAENTNHTIPP